MLSYFCLLPFYFCLPSAPHARKAFKLCAVRFGINQREPERSRQPRPRRAVDLCVQLFDAMLRARFQIRGRQIFPIFITGMLDAGCGLGSPVNQTSGVRLIKRACVSLRERVAGRAQVVTLDGLTRASINGAMLSFRQARRAPERLAHRDRFKARDVNIDEMRVRTTHPARRARPAIFSAMLIVQLDEALISSLDALKMCERNLLFAVCVHAGNLNQP